LKQGDENEEGDVGSEKRGGRGVSSVLQSLPELWDEAEYAEEYDLTQYIANLRKTPA
jgi:hypothetical protein